MLRSFEVFYWSKKKEGRKVNLRKNHYPKRDYESGRNSFNALLSYLSIHLAFFELDVESTKMKNFNAF